MRSARSIFLRALLVALIGLPVAHIAIAQDAIDPNARYCDVSMEVRINGRAVVSPDAIVEFGKEAEITIRDANQPHGWQLKFVVDEPTTIRRATAMPVRIQLFELADDRSFLRAEPHMNLVAGQPASLEMALEDGRKVSLSVTAAILSGEEVQAHIDATTESSD
ncbi:MAG: hypothetical protein ACREPX_09340 [Rhodanobacteraceae bacterium]